MSDPTFDSLLIHTCKIERRVDGAVDDYNVPTHTFTTISAAEPSLLQVMEESIEIEKSGKKEVSNILVFFKITANIAQDDIVTYNSKRYIVLAVEDAAGQGHHYEVFLKSMEN